MLRPVSAPQQHKQPSRKGKKAWRKNVDITEVQTGLETLRKELTQGGPVAEKDSQDLFTVDGIGSEDIKKTYKLQKPLKVDEILANRSAVPGVDSRRRSNSRVTDGIIEPTRKRQKQDWISKKELLRLKQSVQSGSHLTSTLLEDDEYTNFDLWSGDQLPKEKLTSATNFLEVPKPKVAPPTLRRPPIALTVDGRPVRPVLNPKAGTSYNPSFEDWDKLLTEEGEKEVDTEKKRLQAKQAEADKAARVAAAAAEDLAGRTDEESAWEGFKSENERPEVLSRKRPTRKTQAQRNKIKKRKAAESQYKHDQRMGERTKRAADIEAALKMVTVTSGSREVIQQAEDSVSDDGDDTVLRRRRLGNTAIAEKQLELVLPEELQDSLRRLKPEGNLMNDRFRHLLVNGKIESRKPIFQPKKKRRTVTEKWTYKDFSLSV